MVRFNFYCIIAHLLFSTAHKERVMALYSIYAYGKKYRSIGYDKEQMFDDFGSSINHFDVNYSPRPFLADLKRPLKVNFSPESSAFSGDDIPDISEHYGRLFLSVKAYDALKDLIKNDGEFLPVEYEKGAAYMFNTLSVAESVHGLNEQLSSKNEYGDRLSTGFHKDSVRDLMIFKTSYDGYINAFIQEELKQAIEQAKLKGVYFTSELGIPSFNK